LRKQTETYWNIPINLDRKGKTMTEETNAAVEETEVAEASGPQVIAAQNPTPEEMEALRAKIKENYNFNVAVKPVTFRFKKSKDSETGIETVREPLELAIPYPNVDGIIAILEGGGKGLELLIDAVESVVTQQARDLISDDVKLNAANFPVDKLSWEFIANMPKAQRRGGGIPKETWDGFEKDYIEVMQAATDKTVEQVSNAAKILKNKCAQVKTNEPVLELLQGQLAIYAEHTPNLEDYKECVEFLAGKIEQFLNISDEELLANL